MSGQQMDTERLERALGEQTQWDEADPGVWKASIAAHGRTRSRWLSPFAGRSGIAAAVLVVVSAGIIVVALGPTLSGPATRFTAADRSDSQEWIRSGDVVAPSRDGAWELDSVVEFQTVAPPGRADGQSQRQRQRVFRSEFSDSRVAPPATARRIARTATVDLLVDDVHVSYEKAAGLISEADGEYIESSNLSGDPEHMRGTLTMRIASTRLGAVLDELRGFGEVRSERVDGQDVTDQIVDIEARMRNEQRVEAELLDLLEGREDAPLRDILELRSELATVRGSIERMHAQRERLDHLVALSKLVVIISADGEPQPVRGSGLGGHFGGAIGDAWEGGLRNAADSLAALVRFIVGGVVWWVLLACIGLGIWRAWRGRVLAPHAPVE